MDRAHTFGMVAQSPEFKVGMVILAPNDRVSFAGFLRVPFQLSGTQ